MKIIYKPTGINDFHNQGPINLIVSEERDSSWDDDDDCYVISKHQARRIEQHFCGVTGCRCPGGSVRQLDPEGETFGIPVRYCNSN